MADAHRSVRRRRRPLGVGLLRRVFVTLMQMTSVGVDVSLPGGRLRRTPFITGGRGRDLGALTVFKTRKQKRNGKK